MHFRHLSKVLFVLTQPVRTKTHQHPNDESILNKQHQLCLTKCTQVTTGSYLFTVWELVEDSASPIPLYFVDSEICQMAGWSAAKKGKVPWVFLDSKLTLIRKARKQNSAIFRWLESNKQRATKLQNSNHSLCLIKLFNSSYPEGNYSLRSCLYDGREHAMA